MVRRPMSYIIMNNIAEIPLSELVYGIKYEIVEWNNMEDMPNTLTNRQLLSAIWWRIHSYYRQIKIMNAAGMNEVGDAILSMKIFIIQTDRISLARKNNG